MTVKLSDEAVLRLRAEATRRGVTIEELIAELASELPAEATGSGRNPAFVAIGASESGTTDVIDELLAEGFGRD